MKPPSLRLPCIANVAQEVLDELQVDLEQVVALCPFKVYDIQLHGSAARGDWQFHSDLDVLFATGTIAEWDEARARWNNYPDQSRQAMRKLKELSEKWGIRFDFSLQCPDMKNELYKTYYSLRERIHHRPEMNKVVSKYFFTGMDKDGNMVFGKDPYPDEEVEKWAKRYGKDFQRVGFTKDTEWIRDLKNKQDIRPL